MSELVPGVQGMAHGTGTGLVNLALHIEACHALLNL